MALTIAITGGAGYIGSHTAYLLAQQKHNVIIIDSLNHQQPFPHPWATLIKDDFANEAMLEKLFTTHKIDAVMHFAAHIEVGESVKAPLRFYDNNVTKTLTLLKMMLKHNIKHFIFSSSCAVYGEPKYIPLDEEHSFTPISPYGKNKLIIEYVLQDYARAYNLAYVSLRYFNAAGGLPEAG
jgi:UDP-glucose 4-epimerase